MDLVPVTQSDYAFLFDALKERTPSIAVSFKMPTWEKHMRFCRSEPYYAWYIIWVNSAKIGSIYLSKHDEIGIFLLKKYQGKGFGKRSIKMLLKLHKREKYYANVNPKNTRSIMMFLGMGLKHIQNTYILERGKSE